MTLDCKDAAIADASGVVQRILLDRSSSVSCENDWSHGAQMDRSLHPPTPSTRTIDRQVQRPKQHDERPSSNPVRASLTRVAPASQCCRGSIEALCSRDRAGLVVADALGGDAVCDIEVLHPARGVRAGLLGLDGVGG
jgi:hypothetical protein